MLGSVADLEEGWAQITDKKLKYDVLMSMARCAMCWNRPRLQ